MRDELLKLSKHLRAIGFNKEAQLAENIAEKSSEEYDDEPSARDIVVNRLVSSFSFEDPEEAQSKIENVLGEYDIPEELFEDIVNAMIDCGFAE